MYYNDSELEQDETERALDLANRRPMAYFSLGVAA